METDGRAIVTAICVTAFVGFVFGCFVTALKFEINTYDCTVKCPDMNHSIQYNQICYCEIK